MAGLHEATALGRAASVYEDSAALDRPRELIVACPPMRSNVNLSRIVRAAGISRLAIEGDSMTVAARDRLADSEDAAFRPWRSPILASGDFALSLFCPFSRAA